MRGRTCIHVICPGVDCDLFKPVQFEHWCDFIHYSDRPHHRCSGIAAVVLYAVGDRVYTRFVGIDGSRGFNRLRDIAGHVVVRGCTCIHVICPGVDCDLFKPVQLEHRCDFIHYSDRPRHRCSGITTVILYAIGDRVYTRLVGIDSSRGFNRLADVAVHIVERDRPGVRVVFSGVDRNSLCPVKR